VLLTVAKVAKRTLILEVMTENYGRCRAVTTLDGKAAPVLLPGSFMELHCTNDGFGEPLQAKLLDISGGIIASSPNDIGLQVLAAAKDLMVTLLQEEDPAPEIYDATYELMTSLVGEDKRWPYHYAALEFAVMCELGLVHGIEVARPAFRQGETIYLSPKTGTVVTREQAGAFLDRMIPMPGMLMGKKNANVAEVRQALELTGIILERFALPKTGADNLMESRVPVLNAFRRVREIPRAQVTEQRPRVDEEARRRRLMSSKPLMVASRSIGGQ
jgi:DNA repair protein RecO (recombination protein O)